MTCLNLFLKYSSVLLDNEERQFGLFFAVPVLIFPVRIRKQ